MVFLLFFYVLTILFFQFAKEHGLCFLVGFIGMHSGLENLSNSEIFLNRPTQRHTRRKMIQTRLMKDDNNNLKNP